MAIPAFNFQPRLIPSLLILGVMLPLFLSLGIWQIDRAQQKRTLANTMETRRKLPPEMLQQKKISADELEFRTLTVTGHFVPEKQIIISNRKYLGKPGFHIITPLQIEGSTRHILINRGWVAGTGSSLPAIETPTHIITLTGEINIPSAPAIELEFDKHASSLWPFLTLNNFASWSNLEITPFIMLLSANSPHGFVRSWESARPGEGMHLGYATQWFAFALLAFLLWLKLSLTRTNSIASGVSR
ncbi:SURF1 family protein [Sedimenticola selenatireducens]|uniref:SURF1-like protein n=1 Tax=Sedimenticola selenatireducens TaxID=191960 RepID=A0A557SJU2_9GAMM|nr:SURF1 family protein [Sedimenticola selenatireducens]TVO77679.1 SURF1 family protein [Sedimenticola selenatireducens]TVT64985.1 MAG: SURF1 family protein [Sedimenticola selenatireducens]